MTKNVDSTEITNSPRRFSTITTHVLVGVLSSAFSIGGFWLVRHDATIAESAQQNSDIRELKEFKSRVEKNIEEWRADQVRYNASLMLLTKEIETEIKEREAMIRWIDRVSGKLNVMPPAVQQRYPYTPNLGDIKSASGDP